MERIDFFGVPGVGKTTLYNELLKQRRRKEQWLTPEEARICIAKSYLCSRCNSMREQTRLLLLNVVKINVVQKRLTERLTSSLAGKALRRRLIEFMPFIELCAESLGDKNKPPFYRFLLARWFLNNLEEAALVGEFNINKKVLFDESLSQRATGMMPWDYSAGEAWSRKYFELVPLPDAVILLRAEPAQIANRIIGRKEQKINFQHRGLTDNEVRERIKIAAMVVKTGAGILRERGVRILELDALQPIDKMAEETAFFIGPYS